MTELGRILFMRHPETVGNVEHFYSGRRDVALSPEGERQRDRAIEALVAWAPDRILTSPLSRCRCIAEGAAARLGIPATVDDRLVEVEFGALEGVSLVEAHERGIAFPWPLGVEGRSVPMEGGEPLEDLIARAGSFVSWAKTQPGKTACITHGGLTRAIYGAIYREPLDSFWNHIVPNVSSQVFVSDGTRVQLQSAGLTPEELRARAERGFVPGDSVNVTGRN